MADVFPRGDKQLVLEALADTRAVFILGARQVGKSTLAREIANGEHPAQIVNLDDKAVRDAAIGDPEGFVAGLRRPVLIDEVQRGSADLLLAIKATVDEDLSPGQFLLTGSANVLRNKKVADALTGRVEMVDSDRATGKRAGSRAICEPPSRRTCRRSATPTSSTRCPAC